MVKLLDPICDMVVDVEEAREQGLTLAMSDREYAFCSHGCLAKFSKAPSQYIPRVDAWLAAVPNEGHHSDGSHPDELPVIDNGLREWYKSCRCCLSEAYPKVVEVLDAEKAST